MSESFRSLSLSRIVSPLSPLLLLLDLRSPEPRTPTQDYVPRDLLPILHSLTREFLRSLPPLPLVSRFAFIRTDGRNSEQADGVVQLQMQSAVGYHCVWYTGEFFFVDLTRRKEEEEERRGEEGRGWREKRKRTRTRREWNGETVS